MKILRVTKREKSEQEWPFLKFSICIRNEDTEGNNTFGYFHVIPYSNFRIILGTEMSSVKKRKIRTGVALSEFFNLYRG